MQDVVKMLVFMNMASMIVGNGLNATEDRTELATAPADIASRPMDEDVLFDEYCEKIGAADRIVFKKIQLDRDDVWQVLQNLAFYQRVVVPSGYKFDLYGRGMTLSRPVHG